MGITLVQIGVKYIFIPRRACARVTVFVSRVCVCVCVCVSVCLSVTALPASAGVHSGHKRYTRVSQGFSRILTRGFSKHASVPEIWPRLQPFSRSFGTSQGQDLLHRLLSSR